MIEKISKETLYDLYFIQKLTQAEIAKKLGISNGKTSKLFKEYNLCRHQVKEKRNNSSYIDIREDDLKSYINQNKTIKEIAEILGVCVGTINKRLKNFGITIKPKYENNSSLIGRHFGNLKVLSLTKERTKNQTVLWLCQCSCGKICKVATHKLKESSTRSCGSKECKVRWRWTGYKEIYGSHWNIIKNSAEIRKLEFSITIEYVWDLFLKQNRRCALSGMELQFGRRGDQTASLDRIDSTNGYIEGNVQWLHKDINLMKMHLDQNKFIELCGRIWKNNACIIH